MQKRSTQHLAGRILILVFLVVSVFSPVSALAQALDADTATALDFALSGEHRSARNKARDQFRHPKETLAFFGLRRDMSVVEIWPGGGWYTEVLAPVLRGTGKLYAAQYGSTPAFPYQTQEMESLANKAAQYPDVFDEVVFTALSSPNELEIAPAGSVDLIVTFRNVHNWLDPNYRQDPARIFAAFFAALKPGGVLGVVDHRWPDPGNEDPRAAAGYVSEQRVRELAEEAGFEFAGSSDINYNPRDTHDHPNGVWSLPPDLSLPQGEDQQKYMEIGESDLMTLKFTRPVN